MSQENVEIVRSLYAVWNAGDMDALRRRYDPDAMIVRGLDGWTEAGAMVGREADRALRQHEVELSAG